MREAEDRTRYARVCWRLACFAGRQPKTSVPPSAREKHTDEKADPGGDKRGLNGLLLNLPVG